MKNFNQYKEELNEKGFSIVDNCFNKKELNDIKKFIEENNFNFSERQLLNRFPEFQSIIFESKLFKELLNAICSEGFFLSKAIYFNKLSESNWFVSYHQDISISVKNKTEDEGFSKWTNKKGQLGVIPPIQILENIITVRIHLDNADQTNGALKVILKSHNKGIIRVDNSFNANDVGEEVFCELKEGSVMLMKPLLLHSSQKNNI